MKKGRPSEGYPCFGGGGGGGEESVGVSGKSVWKMLAGGIRHVKNSKKWNLLMLQKFQPFNMHRVYVFINLFFRKYYCLCKICRGNARAVGINE